MKFVLLIEGNEDCVNRFRTLAVPEIRIVHARSSGMALGMLRRDKYAGILLDHDLSKGNIIEMDASISGNDLLATIIETQSMGTPVFIHFLSPDGSLKMARRLQATGFDVTRIPYAEITDAMLRGWFSTIAME